MAGQNWRKNKKGFMVNPDGKTARQVRQEKYAAKKAEAKAKASGGGGAMTTADAPKPEGRSRIGKLIASIEANQKADVKNYRSVLKVADKANAMAGGKAGGQPTAQQDATRSQLLGTAEKKGRFSQAVSDLERIDKADLKNAAKTYGATAQMMKNAKTATSTKELKQEEKKLLKKGESKDSKKIKDNTSQKQNNYPEAWGGSLAELKQQDRNPLNQAIDTKQITARTPASRYSKQEIEDLAVKIARGETDQLNPVLVKKVGFEQYEVVRGTKDFYAVQRAQELNREVESVETFLVKPNEFKAAKKQLSLFKNDKITILGRGERLQIDIADIDSSSKANKRTLSIQSKSLLEVGGNLVPVVLKKKKGGRFEVISGHQIYHAAVQAKNQQKSFEVLNAVILD